MRVFREALRVATRTDGVVTYRALVESGVDRRAVARLRDAGAIHRAITGAYVVGLPELTQRQLHRLGLVVAGRGGGVTERASFELRGAASSRVGVTTIATARRNLRGPVLTEVPMATGGRGLIRVRRVRTAPPTESVDGLDVVAVPRALIHLAAGPDRDQLEAVWRQAEFRGILDGPAIAAELAATRRRGHVEVRELLERRRILTGTGTDLRSLGELDVLHLIAESGLPIPQVNAPLTFDGRCYYGDFVWLELGLVLELDTPDHLDPVRAALDRKRDQVFLANGFHTIRYLDSDARSDPVAFIFWLTRALDAHRALVA